MKQVGSPCLTSASIGYTEGSVGAQVMAMALVLVLVLVLALVLVLVIVMVAVLVVTAVAMVVCALCTAMTAVLVEEWVLFLPRSTLSKDQIAHSWESRDNARHLPSSCSTK